jgi:hypothetical protein
MRRHLNGHLAHADAKPFTDFLAERQVMDMADLDVASMREISHETSITLARETEKTGLSAGRHKTSFQYFHP